MEGIAYTSGDWTVKAGSEETFVGRWTEFVTWSKQNASGAGSFTLLRDAKEPQHFVSFGSWRDDASVQAWRERPEFMELLGSCRAVCEAFEGRDYRRVAAV
jgi:heme-degrading monooxygenase HmoA